MIVLWVRNELFCLHENHWFFNTDQLLNIKHWLGVEDIRRILFKEIQLIQILGEMENVHTSNNEHSLIAKRTYQRITYI